MRRSMFAAMALAAAAVLAEWPTSIGSSTRTTTGPGHSIKSRRFDSGKRRRRRNRGRVAADTAIALFKPRDGRGG